MTVTAPHLTEYFRLAQGKRFEETDWSLDDWTITYGHPLATNYLTVESTNGQLHIYGDWPGSGLDRRVMLYRTNVVLADFAMSIDILGWDERAGDQCNIVLFARLDPSIRDHNYAFAYLGGASTSHYANSSRSALWLWENAGATGRYLGDLQMIEKMEASNDYRLEFYGVGSELTVRLLNLTDGEIVHEYSQTDNTYTNGWVGFYAHEHGSSGTVDFWLDNFVVVGTTP